MQIYNFSDMKGGWFVGDFSPTAFQTKACEVSYKKHYKGEEWPRHYHAVATEINFLIKGKMLINSEEINTGQIFVIYPVEAVKPIFLEDCELIVIKTPSVKGDKYEV